MLVFTVVEQEAGGIQRTKASVMHVVAHAEALRRSAAVDWHGIAIQSINKRKQ